LCIHLLLMWYEFEVHTTIFIYITRIEYIPYKEIKKYVITDANNLEENVAV